MAETEDNRHPDCLFQAEAPVVARTYRSHDHRVGPLTW